MRVIDSNSPLTIKEILNKVLKEIGIPVEPVGPELKRAWEKAVGPLISSHNIPYSFKRGTLTVLCSSPHWMLELQMLKEQILSKLHAELGGQKVKRLAFKLGQLLSREEERQKELNVEISKEEAESLTAPLKDKELKEQVVRILKAIRAKAQGPSF